MHSSPSSCGKTGRWKRWEFGAVGLNVNDTSDLQAPFGGWEMSVVGRELGPEGLEAFLETKHLKMRVLRI